MESTWDFTEIIEENTATERQRHAPSSLDDPLTSTPQATPSWSPFNEFQGISDTSFLYTLSDRNACPKCQKPVKYFCYLCFEIVGCPRENVPKIKLPVKMDVIKHENELDGKSTAVHAKIIAPDEVEIYPWNKMPKYVDPDDVLLLFVGKDAKTLSQIPKGSFSKLVVVDGTWAQATKMVRETPQLARMRHVTIAPRKTFFWRFQNKDEHHLATIEAIYYFFREYYDAYEAGARTRSDGGVISDLDSENRGQEQPETVWVEGNADMTLPPLQQTADESGSASVSTLHEKIYDGRYDDLLFYYKFFYEMIQEKYRQDRGKRAFNKRQREGYIQYEDE